MSFPHEISGFEKSLPLRRCLSSTHTIGLLSSQHYKKRGKDLAAWPQRRHHHTTEFPLHPASQSEASYGPRFQKNAPCHVNSTCDFGKKVSVGVGVGAPRFQNLAQSQDMGGAHSFSVPPRVYFLPGALCKLKSIDLFSCFTNKSLFKIACELCHCD